MRKLIIAVFVVLMIVTGILGQAATVRYNGVEFDYPPASFGAVLPAYDEGTPYQTDAPYFANVAPHTTFTFMRPNPAHPDVMINGMLNVYKIADLEAYQEPSYMQVVEELRTLDTTTLDSYANVSVTGGEKTLPFMPVVNAAQVFRAQPGELNFENVKGIQYFAYYSQAVDPIIEGQVMYTYQGITTDGQYYLSFMIYVETGLLETDIPQDLNYDQFAADYPTYLQDIFTAINTADAGTFTPSAGDLSSFIQSIRVVE